MILYAHTKGVDEDAQKYALLKYIVIYKSGQTFSYLPETLAEAVVAGGKASEKITWIFHLL